MIVTLGIIFSPESVTGNFISCFREQTSQEMGERLSEGWKRAGNSRPRPHWTSPLPASLYLPPKPFETRISANPSWQCRARTSMHSQSRDFRRSSRSALQILELAFSVCVLLFGASQTEWSKEFVNLANRYVELLLGRGRHRALRPLSGAVSKWGPKENLT